LADGRGVKVMKPRMAFYVAQRFSTMFKSGTTVAKEEIFGPVLNVMHMEDLGKAIELANKSMYATALPFSRGAARRRANSSTAPRPA